MNKKWLVKARRWFLSARYGFWVPPYDGMMDERRCCFLYRTVLNHPGSRETVVEIGSFKGCSTAWIGVAAKRAGFKDMLAIDLFTGTPSWGEKWDTYDEFMTRLKRNHLENFVRTERGHSRDVAKKLDPKVRISVLYVDADHTYEAARADIENYLPFLEPDGIVIVDDHDDLHPGVLRAVEDIKQKGFVDVAGCVALKGCGGGNIVLQRKTPVIPGIKEEH